MEKKEVNDLLREKSSLKIAVIGIGNAGNQLLTPAKENGFSVFAINSSDKDLSDNLVDSTIPSFLIGWDSRGAAQNRALALKAFKFNGQDLLEKTPIFTDMCNESDVIVVAGATAGGTGSGVAPSLIGLLKPMYPGKIFIYFGVLPRLTEAIQSQINSIECLGEIQKLGIPYVLGDVNYYTSVADNDAYKGIQKYFIDALNIMSGKYLNYSSYGMIDENDMRSTIGEPGYMSFYQLDKISQNMLDSESFQHMMIKQIKNSPAAPKQRDMFVSKIAVIINTPEETVDPSKNGDFSELSTYIGTPRHAFKNYAITNNMYSQMSLIMSGQTDPIDRISAMEELVNDYHEKESKRKHVDISSMLNDSDASGAIPDFLSGSSGPSAAGKSVMANFFGKTEKPAPKKKEADPDE